MKNFFGRRIYGRRRFLWGIFCFAMLPVLVVMQIFTGFDMMSTVVCVFSVPLGLAYILAGLSYEASLEDSGEEQDERSVELMHLAKSRAYDFWLEFSFQAGFIVFLLDRGFESDIFAFIFIGVELPVAITLIAQISFLNRLDSGAAGLRSRIKDASYFATGVAMLVIAAAAAVAQLLLWQRIGLHPGLSSTAAAFTMIGLYDISRGVMGTKDRKRF